jgi:hypothetical protein
MDVFGMLRETGGAVRAALAVTVAQVTGHAIPGRPHP